MVTQRVSYANGEKETGESVAKASQGSARTEWLDANKCGRAGRRFCINVDSVGERTAQAEQDGAAADRHSISQSKIVHKIAMAGISGLTGTYTLYKLAGMELVPLTIQSGAAIIPLTRGKFALVDLADWDHLSQVKWCAMGPTTSGRYYAVRRQNGTGKTIYMHRYIMGASKSETVDHKENPGLDNRRSNLRICTQQQNTMNRSIDRRSKSGFKGVSFHRAYGRWEAYLHVDWRKRCIGFYDSAEEAARAYDIAAFARFGEFAKLNFDPKHKENGHAI